MPGARPLPLHARRLHLRRQEVSPHHQEEREGRNHELI